MNHLPLSCLLVLGACTTPNIAPEVKTAGELLQVSTAKVRPVLQARANVEQRRAEAKVIAADGTVYKPEGCDDTDPFLIASECRLTNLVKVDPTQAPATDTLLTLDAVEGYFTSLLALASSDSTDAIGNQAKALNSALEAASKAKYEPLARLTDSAAGNSEKTLAVVVFLSNQRRIAQLRRIVNAADPTIAKILRDLANKLDPNPEFLVRYGAFRKALAELEAAQDTRNPNLQRQALDQLKNRHTAFIKSQNESIANSFRLLRVLHGDLRTQLNAPGDASAVLATVTEMRAVVDLLRKKDG